MPLAPPFGPSLPCHLTWNVGECVVAASGSTLLVGFVASLEWNTNACVRLLLKCDDSGKSAKRLTMTVISCKPTKREVSIGTETVARDNAASESNVVLPIGKPLPAGLPAKTSTLIA